MQTTGAAIAVFLTALLVYLASLCPTVSVGDSGELAWAAASLGIAHPPGYPLWTLAGRVAVIASSAEPVVALNGMSALFGAASAGLLAVLLALLTGRVAVSAGVALAFALSRTVWSTSVITEVYSLNLLLTVSALVSAVAARRGRPRLFLLAAYLLGLGTANHPFVLLAALPVLLLALLPGDGPPGHAAAGPRRLLPMAGLFVLGLTAYLYLPVRWSAGPEMNWGGIRELSEIRDHILRVQYGGLGEARAVTSLGLRLRVLFEILGRDVSVPLLLAGAFGFVHLARTGHAKRAGLLGLFLLVAGPVTAGVIRYGDTFLDRTVVSVFFLPAVMAAFLAVGAGVAGIDHIAKARLAGQPRVALLFTGLLTVIVPALLYQRNAAACDRSRSTLARAYARTLLRSLPEGARLHAMGDSECFSLVYFHRVEGIRPDIQLADRTLNLLVESYGPEFLDRTRPERKRDLVSREVEIVFDEPDRPVFYTDLIDLTRFGGCRLVPSGLAYQLLRPGEVPAEIRYEPFPLPPVDTADFLESHLAGATLFKEGEFLAREGRTQEARERFRQAAELCPEDATVLRNVGLAHLDLGDMAEAGRRFQEALEIEPENVDALYDLAILYALMDRVPESLLTFERLVALDPPFAEVYLSQGIQLVRAGRLEDAGAAARKALEIEPDLESAKDLESAVRAGLEVGGEVGVLEAQRRVEPFTAEGTLQLAERYVERGDLGRATDLYREAYRQAPENVTAIYGLGYGLLRVGQYDEAAEAFRRILALDPQNADGRNALAYIFALTGDSLATADSLVTEALELAPALAAYWYDTLGWVRYRAGDPEAALEALHEAEDRLPADDLSMRAENDYHIGVVLMALGRGEEAKTYLRRSAQRAQDETWVPDLRARARELGLEVESM